MNAVYECCWFPGHKHNYQTDLWHDRLLKYIFFSIVGCLTRIINQGSDDNQL